MFSQAKENAGNFGDASEEKLNSSSQVCKNQKKLNLEKAPKERVILHSDLNNFFASVECLLRPELAGLPVAVGGDLEKRHGIILAKNILAKAAGVVTAEPLWQAKRKCPNLVIVPPNYQHYYEFSQKAKAIYGEYTDLVESFGIDEAWLDVTGSLRLYGSGVEIANQIRQRMRQELGITCSVGVSYNKIFAKLGSDYKKPDAVTVITSTNYEQIVWPLPVRDLLFVGKATQERLQRLNIHTIGELARTDPNLLVEQFGKNGQCLWVFANGEDKSPVTAYDENSEVKSIGNGSTTPQDLVNFAEVKILFRVLAETVATRLRQQNLKAVTVQITIKSNDLKSFNRQCRLVQPSYLAKDLAEMAAKLFYENYNWQKPVRALTIRACNLVPADAGFQLDLFLNQRQRQKEETLAKTLDSLRNRFGSSCIKPALFYEDRDFGDFNSKYDDLLEPDTSEDLQL